MLTGSESVPFVPVLGRLDLLVVHGGGGRQLQRRRPLDRRVALPVRRRGRGRRRGSGGAVEEDVRVDVEGPLPAPQPRPVDGAVTEEGAR